MMRGTSPTVTETSPTPKRACAGRTLAPNAKTTINIDSNIVLNASCLFLFLCINSIVFGLLLPETAEQALHQKKYLIALLEFLNHLKEI